MGVITLKIDGDLEERLRKRVGRTRGAERGAISQSVEQAIRLWLKAPQDMESKQKDDPILYIAKKDNKKLAEANSLASLSFKLKEAHIDPRDVIVESIPKVPSERKTGLRTTAYRQK